MNKLIKVAALIVLSGCGTMRYGAQSGSYGQTPDGSEVRPAPHYGPDFRQDPHEITQVSAQSFLSPDKWLGALSKGPRVSGSFIATGTITSQNVVPSVTNLYTLGSASFGYVSLFLTGTIANATDSEVRFGMINNLQSYINGDTPNTSTNVAVSIGNVAALTGDTYILRLCQSSGGSCATPRAYVHNRGFFLNPVEDITLADDAAGTSPAATITPMGENATCTCNDANGCTITMGETNIPDGAVVRITSMGTNACNFADTAGVTELAGAFSAGTYDTLTLKYQTDRWVEISRSNN